MHAFGILFASIGVVVLLGALTYVNLLIVALVHGMIVLMAGKPIDDFLRKRGKAVFEPGSLK